MKWSPKWRGHVPLPADGKEAKVTALMAPMPRAATRRSRRVPAALPELPEVRNEAVQAADQKDVRAQIPLAGSMR